MDLHFGCSVTNQPLSVGGGVILLINLTERENELLHIYAEDVRNCLSYVEDSVTTMVTSFNFEVSVRPR